MRSETQLDWLKADLKRVLGVITIHEFTSKCVLLQTRDIQRTLKSFQNNSPGLRATETLSAWSDNLNLNRF